MRTLAKKIEQIRICNESKSKPRFFFQSINRQRGKISLKYWTIRRLTWKLCSVRSIWNIVLSLAEKEAITSTNDCSNDNRMMKFDRNDIALIDRTIWQPRAGFSVRLLHSCRNLKGRSKFQKKETLEPILFRVDNVWGWFHYFGSLFSASDAIETNCAFNRLNCVFFHVLYFNW